MESKKILQGRRKKCSKDFVDMPLTEEIDIVGGINAGSFGDIYLGRNNVTMEEYAIKFDKNKTKRSLENFEKEYRILRKIERTGRFPKCCLVKFTPTDSEEILTAMVMEKLGPNIYDMFKLCDKHLSHQTICWLMIDLLKRMKEFHANGFVHRDIKPENFCLGARNLDKIYLIDFGLSRNYINSNGEHIPLSKNRGFVGTRRYASRHAHKGYLQSRRDDLEAVGYLGVFLGTGTLPWQDLKTEGTSKKEKHKKLYDFKKKTNLKTLCEELPPPMEKFLREVRNLGYDETPRYDRYIKWFHSFCKENEYERVFDWEEDPDFLKVLKGWKKWHARMQKSQDINYKDEEESTKDR